MCVIVLALRKVRHSYLQKNSLSTLISGTTLYHNRSLNYNLKYTVRWLDGNYSLSTSVFRPDNKPWMLDVVCDYKKKLMLCSTFNFLFPLPIDTYWSLNNIFVTGNWPKNLKYIIVLFMNIRYVLLWFI